MLFDENGNPVEEVINNDDNDIMETCPNCGTIFVIGNDVVASKTKERVCPTCGAIVGEW